MSALAYIASSGATGTKVTSGSTATATLGAAVNYGDRVVVLVDVHDSVANSCSSVTDSLGNTYQSDASTSFGTGKVSGAIFSSFIKVAGTPTITANFTALTSGGAVVAVAAYSGTRFLGSAVDVSQTATGTLANATTGATSTKTSFSNELVIGGYFDDGSNTSNLSAGAGFTARATFKSDATVEICLEDKTSTTPATQTATFTSAAGNWGALCVVYYNYNSSVFNNFEHVSAGVANTGIMSVTEKIR